MNVRQFRKYLADSLNTVASTGEPLPVNNWGQPHVVVVSPERWEEAEEALREKKAAEQGRQGTAA